MGEFHWQLLQSCDVKAPGMHKITQGVKGVFKFDSLTHNDQSADNSKLDSKPPYSNKSIFLFYFLTNGLSACQQLGELLAVSQRKSFELCTCFCFFCFFECRAIHIQWYKMHSTRLECTHGKFRDL